MQIPFIWFHLMWRSWVLQLAMNKLMRWWFKIFYEIAQYLPKIQQRRGCGASFFFPLTSLGCWYIVVVWKEKVQLCGKGEEVQTAYIGNVFSFCRRVKYNISQYGIIAHKPQFCTMSGIFERAGPTRDRAEKNQRGPVGINWVQVRWFVWLSARVNPYSVNIGFFCHPWDMKNPLRLHGSGPPGSCILVWAVRTSWNQGDGKRMGMRLCC